MGKSARNRGQSLVELSLLLPVVFFMVLLMLQFFFIVRTKLVLGFSADRIARAAAARGHPTAVQLTQFATHFTVGPIWGAPLPARVSQETLPRWPAYSGLLVVRPLNPRGRLAVVYLSYMVFPKMGFNRFIYVPTLGAHVELPMEPEIPDL